MTPRVKLNSSDLFADLGLEPLLRYIANPQKYICNHRDNPECSDAQRADWDAWAKSRADYIHKKLFPVNAGDDMSETNSTKSMSKNKLSK